MRIEPTTIHPTVWTAIDECTYEAYWNVGKGLLPAQRSAVSKHEKIWYATYGKGCALWAVGLAGVFFGTVSAVPKDLKGIAAFASVCLALLVFTMLYRKNKRQITLAELEALIPALNLSPVQRTYVEALVALQKLSLPASTHNELVSQLNELLDEEARLLQVRERASEGIIAESLPDQVDEIERRLGDTTDPVAREALVKSLEIARNRMAASRDIPVLVQRIDAQVMMIGQSVGSMRDTLTRLSMAPEPDANQLDLSPIRDAVQQAQVHASALESAVNEVQGLTA